MGFWDFMEAPNINMGVEEYRNTKGAVLVDVRRPEEYAQGHIPNSINVPLQSFMDIEQRVKDKSTPVYVYCHSGARSKRAAAAWKRHLGYTNVANIGGIAEYTGKIERNI